MPGLVLELVVVMYEGGGVKELGYDSQNFPKIDRLKYGSSKKILKKKLFSTLGCQFIFWFHQSLSSSIFWPFLLKTQV